MFALRRARVASLRVPLRLSRCLSSVDPATINKSVQIAVNVNVPASGDKLKFVAHEGESLQSVAETEQDLLFHIPCTCGGNAACSTCHVYVDSSFYSKLPPPEDEELDMLDMAWGYEEGRSRLGCCLRFSKDIDGIVVEVPEQSNNLF